MSSPLPSISDEDLHGFVDGELDPGLKKAILARLAASPVDAARAEALCRQNEALRAAFADVLTEPTSPALLPCAMSVYAETLPATSVTAIPGASSGRFRRDGSTRVSLCLGFVAGAAAALAAGLLAERLDTRKHPRQGSESRAPIVGRSDGPFVERTLQSVVPYESVLADTGSGARQSAVVSIVPNLSDAGLRLTGIRTNPGSPSGALCLLYRSATNVEVTLCIDTARSELEPPRRKPNDASGPALSWRQNGARYSLAGPLADTELALLADRARAEIDKFVGR